MRHHRKWLNYQAGQSCKYESVNKIALGVVKSLLCFGDRILSSLDVQFPLCDTMVLSVVLVVDMEFDA
jgi:hypothetical protein